MNNRLKAKAMIVALKICVLTTSVRSPVHKGQPLSLLIFHPISFLYCDYLNVLNRIKSPAVVFLCVEFL
jgi:hypothetical protein